MKSCSCFGHRKIEVDKRLENRIEREIEQLIKKGYGIFYFGGFGEFDDLCYKITSRLKEKYNHIKRVFCLIEQKQLNKKPEWLKKEEYEEYVYFNLEFDWWYSRIYYRNCEIINKSDFIIFYVLENQSSGAYKAYKYAKKQKKEMINLAK